MKSSKLFVAGAAIALLPLSAAFAQTPDPATEQPASSDQSQAAPAPQSKGSTFEALDANGDGKISKDEAESNPNVKAQFASYDLNGDGFIERAEVTQANGAKSSTPKQ